MLIVSICRIYLVKSATLSFFTGIRNKARQIFHANRRGIKIVRESRYFHVTHRRKMLIQYIPDIWTSGYIAVFIVVIEMLLRLNHFLRFPPEIVSVLLQGEISIKSNATSGLIARGALSQMKT